MIIGLASQVIIYYEGQNINTYNKYFDLPTSVKNNKCLNVKY